MKPPISYRMYLLGKKTYPGFHSNYYNAPKYSIWFRASFLSSRKFFNFWNMKWKEIVSKVRRKAEIDFFQNEELSSNDHQSMKRQWGAGTKLWYNVNADDVFIWFSGWRMAHGNNRLVWIERRLPWELHKEVRNVNELNGMNYNVRTLGWIELHRDLFIRPLRARLLKPHYYSREALQNYGIRSRWYYSLSLVTVEQIESYY